jgi:lysophospholipase L1-like esterase
VPALKKTPAGKNHMYHGRDITLAAMIKVHYFPYLEHSNIPAPGEGKSQPEKSGYRKNRFMYQYTKKEILRHAGQRFDHIYQDKTLDAANTDLYRVFFMGNSLAYGFGIDLPNRYYSILQRDFDVKKQNIRIIPAAVSAINSTQENILFHMAVLPQKPNFVVLINGWNDVMLPAIFNIRPGDPMTMSPLYGKYDHLFFNLLIRVCQKSNLASRLVTKLLESDRKDFINLFNNDLEFRDSISQSIVNVYMHNLETIAEGCRYRGIEFLHVLQPSGDVLWERSKDQFSHEQQKSFLERMDDYPWAKLKLGPFLSELYSRICTEIAKKEWASDSYDPMAAFSLDHFSDPVHLNQEGQVVLAKELEKLIEHRISNRRR